MAESSNRQKDIFLKALDLSSPDEQAAFLAQACGTDASLRRQVEAMLRAHAASDSFLEKPAAAMGPTIDELPARPEKRGGSEGPPARVGPYKLLQEIGEGGMGVVYMAEQQEPVRRKVALKIIKPGMDSGQVIARFEAERQALAMMDHQNIARVLDAGTTDGEPGSVSSGRPYFVMELVHGVPITKFCDDSQLSPRQRLELFIPVCHAIQHAHQKGIIHRDIKPSNVLVTMYDDKPVPKVIDFGVAKAVEQRLTEKTLFTQFGALVGTFEYMSPEQAEMNAFGVDTRSDIYSLGVLLYELLTGTTPLEKTRVREAGLNEVVRLIKEEEPPRPSARLSSSGTLAKIAAARKMEPAQLTKLVRGELDWIVMKSLEKDRSRRYETANGMAQDVQRFLTDEPVQAGPPSAAYRLRKFVKRNRGPVMVATLVALTLLAGIIGTSWGWVEALWQRDEAMQARQDEAQQRKKEKEARDEADRLAKKEKAARQLMEAHLALERARTHFDRDQVTPGLHWLVRGLEAVPETEPDLEHALRVLLAGWGREIHPCKQVVVLAGLQIESDFLLAQSPDGTVQVRPGPAKESKRIDPDPEISIELWNTDTGKRLGQLTDLRAHTSFNEDGRFTPYLRLAFTPDSKRLIAAWQPLDKEGLPERWLLRTWDVASRKPIGAAKHVFPPDDSNPSDLDKEIHALVISPDAKRLATTVSHYFSTDDNLGVQLLEIPSGKRIGELLPTRALAVFSPDSRTLLTVGQLPRDPLKIGKLQPAEIRLWDTDNGKAKQKPFEFRLWGPEIVRAKKQPYVASEVHAAAFSPDGQTLLTGVTWLYESQTSYHIAIQRTGTSGMAAFLDYNFPQPIHHLAFAPDGKTVLAQSLEGPNPGHETIHLFKFNNDRYWDGYAMPRLEALGSPIPEAEFIAFSPDGKAVLLLTKNRYRLWDTTIGEPLGEPFADGPETVMRQDETEMVNSRQKLAARFESDGKSVRIARGEKVYRFAVNMPRPAGPLSKSTHQVDHLPVGQSFNYPSTNIKETSKFVLWDRALNKQVGTPLSYGAGKKIYGPLFSPDGRKLLTLGDFAQLWDAATHKPVGAPIPNRAIA